MYIHTYMCITAVLLKLATNHNMTTHNQHVRNKKAAITAAQQNKKNCTQQNWKRQREEWKTETTIHPEGPKCCDDWNMSQHAAQHQSGCHSRATKIKQNQPKRPTINTNAMLRKTQTTDRAQLQSNNSVKNRLGKNGKGNQAMIMFIKPQAETTQQHCACNKSLYRHMYVRNVV